VIESAFPLDEADVNATWLRRWRKRVGRRLQARPCEMNPELIGGVQSHRRRSRARWFGARPAESDARSVDRLIVLISPD
jgi:hypothetical protein